MKRLNVLVVDDSPTTSAILAKTLTDLGHRVGAAVTTGAAALAAYRAARPDLVTMDIVMPDMDGIEATRQILALDPGATIVMVTSQRRQSMVVKALAAGARGYVTQPIDRSELEEVIRMTARYRAMLVRGQLTWQEDGREGEAELAPLRGIPSRPLRALIVEDSPISTGILNRMLTDLGHQVVDTAMRGGEALAAYRACSPDLVTMDIVMPDQDGIATTRQIIRQFPRALVIMITSEGRKSMLVKALAAGARGYVVQPIDKASLREAIEMAQRFRAKISNGNLAWELR